MDRSDNSQPPGRRRASPLPSGSAGARTETWTEDEAQNVSTLANRRRARHQTHQSIPLSGDESSSQETAELNIILTQANKGAIKRAGYPILNGYVSSWKEKSGDFLCSICFETFNEAQVTRCGHTFCRACILSSIEIYHKCPQCSTSLEIEDVVPNYALVSLIAKQITEKHMKIEMLESQAKAQPQQSEVKQFLQTNYNNLDLNDVNLLLSMLQHKKETLTVEAVEHQHSLTKSFLSQLLKEKTTEKKMIQRTVSIIERDLSIFDTPSSISESTSTSSYSHVDDSAYSNSNTTGTIGFNDSSINCLQFEQPTLPARKRRMAKHYGDLRKIYFDLRKSVTSDVLYTDNYSEMSMNNWEDVTSLQEFGETLSRVTRFSAFKPLATLFYSDDPLPNSSIVSSIEFDKENEYFAIAGVTKKIKIFEYASAIGSSSVDIHCPTSELSCAAKISCLAWNCYFKCHLASSDYGGCVTHWDTATSTKIRSYIEHEKRVWSVDWSNGDPRLLASGSDDSKVKLWSTTTEKSVANLEMKSNVCCVKFCPENTYTLAFGSADHCVYYYDLRSIKEPLGIMYGHKKAVSYVKFASKNELVSASTDSNLKLWDLVRKEEIRSFQGHLNEKNFAGLATDGHFIACGSENNSIYLYHKSVSASLFSFTFENQYNMLDGAKSDGLTGFVSAVAWKKGSPILIAANSQGIIKVLQLQ